MVHIVFDAETDLGAEPKKKGWKKRPLQFVEPKAPKKKAVIHKQSFNYKENSIMTKCDGMWVKKEFVEEYDQLKSSLEGQILEPKEKKMKLLKARRRAHKQLRMELFKKAEKKPKKLKDIQKTLKPQTAKEPKSKKKTEKKKKVKAEEEDVSEPKPKKAKKKNTGLTAEEEPSSQQEETEEKETEADNAVKSKKKESKTKKSKKGEINKSDQSTAPKDAFMSIKFEENDIMTQFQGVWVKKEAIEELKTVEKKNKESILASRTNGNKSKALSKAEKITLSNSIKKKLKMEHRRLKNELLKQMKEQQ